MSSNEKPDGPLEVLLVDASNEVLREHRRWAREDDIYFEMLPDRVERALSTLEDVLARMEDADDG